MTYRPYDEWWNEKVSCRAFGMSLTYHIHTFNLNLSTHPNPKPMTRKEWMETFLLWLEYDGTQNK